MTGYGRTPVKLYATGASLLKPLNLSCGSFPIRLGRRKRALGCGVSTERNDFPTTQILHSYTQLRIHCWLLQKLFYVACNPSFYVSLKHKNPTRTSSITAFRARNILFTFIQHHFSSSLWALFHARSQFAVTTIWPTNLSAYSIIRAEERIPDT